MIIYHRWNLKNWRIVWKTGFKNYREKAELEARVFCTSENNGPLVRTDFEIEEDFCNAYERQLLIHLVLLPDAAALDIGWLEEEDERCF